MGELPRLLKHGVLGILLAGTGCSDQDAQKISKVTGKAFDKASQATTQAGEKIGLSIRGAKTAIDGLEVAGRVQSRLKWDQQLEGAAIKVQADKGAVTLSGSVVNEVQRLRAVELAKSTTGVETVTDSLEIAQPKQSKH